MLRPYDVASGIQAFATRTPTLPPATHTNSYAIGERDVLLVEPATPYGDEQREWLAWARGLVSSGRHPLAVFLTHHHPDHAGGVAALSRELGLPTWAHAVTADRLETPIDRRLSDGEAIVLEGPRAQRWSVLHTPGHAPGHLCLHEAELGTLVAGDMVASEGTILVETTDGDMRAYLDQLARLRRLGTRCVLPAHGAPITDPDALFERYIRHRTMREAKILSVVRRFGEQGATLAEIVPAAYDDTPVAVHGLAALSSAAHLVKLEREGLVTSHGERYRSVEAP
jgi:glyoxylase-like metal-dependent hydrolase (beta-lactamase superfamily II)